VLLKIEATGMRDAAPGPSPGEVHIWRIALDCAAALPRCEAVLSPEERERAARFKLPELRLRSMVAHGALRMILARYAGAAPEALVFATGAQGKPSLVGKGAMIGFNLTHTGALALVAVAAEGAVGIDAEIINPQTEWEDLSRRFFAPAEAEEICAQLPSRRIAAFFACWTRKEAYIKALGTGLSTPLDSFRVSVDAHPRLLWVEGREDEPGRWHFADVGEPGVAAALALRRPDATVRRFAFVPPDG